MDYYVKKLSENRGRPRIYLDGLQAARAGFVPGDAYDIRIEEGVSVTLYKNPDGSRTVSGRKNRKTGERTTPVIDVESEKILEMFSGMDEVRMIVRPDVEEVVFLPKASEQAKKERLDRLWNAISKNEEILVGSLTHGLGILAKSIHDGLIEAGLKPTLALANELREDLLDLARQHNPAWSPRTMGIAAPMQELIQDQWLMNKIPKLHFLDLSLPCSGASKAGHTKNKLEMMEQHEHVGHLVFAALVIISKVQPAVLLLENVPQYAKSASAEILRKQLTDMGYDIHEAVVNGYDAGCLEARERWCLVATTKGLTFDFDQLYPPVEVRTKVGDILDDVPLDSSRWRTNEGLLAKEKRDIEDGKGFRLPIVTEESTKVPTIRKHYQKAGSCDVQVQHPTDPDRARLFTGPEHLRIKGISPELFGEDASDAIIHQAAGQAVQPPVFIPIAKRIGETMKAAQPYSAAMKALRSVAIEEIANGLKDGIEYDPAPASFATVAQGVVSRAYEVLQQDLFAEIAPTAPAQVTESEPSKVVKKARKIAGGGVG
jgi:DNA (cytosine-5)-methyltransferase 1